MDHLMNLSLSEPQAAPKKGSVLQEAIYAAIRETHSPILINAKAGSGKTTTLIRATEFTSTPTIYLAFAKANAEDLKSRLPDPKMARTINSLGHGMWMRSAPGAQMDFDKIEKIVSRMTDLETRKRFGYVIGKLVEKAKNAGIGLDSSVEARHFENFIVQGEWDIDTSDVSQVAELAAGAFRASVADIATLDFSDQIYGPIFQGWKFPSFGTVLVDEAQDLNYIQHQFLVRLAQQGARVIAVGDPNQAIYAFRGALHDSLDRMKRQFDMIELPLSVCYRCSEKVIKEAQRLVPGIQAREGAPEGAVLDRLTEVKKAIVTSWASGEEDNSGEPQDPELWDEGWLVICRNNAPLFAAVMRHVRARRPCRVLSNALEGLSAFIRRLKPKDCEDLILKVERWREREVLAAEAKGMPWKAASIHDKAGTVIELASGFHSVYEVTDLITQLAQSRSGPVFATIHKAKGLEAPHTYLLRPDLVPSPWAKSEEDIQQENNLLYVAITRAQETFTYGLRKQK
jgi:DNA helicase-2/ATP-dependent DNA helicase PcrA